MTNSNIGIGNFHSEPGASIGESNLNIFSVQNNIPLIWSCSKECSIQNKLEPEQ